MKNAKRLQKPKNRVRYTRQIHTKVQKVVENREKMHRHNMFLEKDVVDYIRVVAMLEKRTFSQMVRIILERYVDEHRAKPR